MKRYTAVWSEFASPDKMLSRSPFHVSLHAGPTNGAATLVSICYAHKQQGLEQTLRKARVLLDHTQVLFHTDWIEKKKKDERRKMVDFPDLLAAAAIDNEINDDDDDDDGPPREVTVPSDHGVKDDVDELIDDLLSESHDYTATKNKFNRVEEESKKSFDSSPVTDDDTTQFRRPLRCEVIHIEDDSERLSSRDFSQDGKGFNKARSASSRRSDDDTSETSESDDSFQNDNRAGSSGQSYSSENEDDSSEANNSDGTQVLLERAHDRIALQGLQDEIQSLKAVIAKKNMEVEHISGQLRRAISTKCDLVLAHTELEKHHEYNLHMKEQESHMLMKANFGLLENRAGLEKVGFMFVAAICFLLASLD
jgi:hypothetical protein